MDVTAIAEALLSQEAPNAALDLAADTLEDHGFSVDRREDPGALIAHRGEDGVMLSGHVDVVPAGQGWSHEPFGGTVQDGRLYGRGASDMRGAVACMLAAAATTDVPAGLVLTSDEETTMDTARALVGEGLMDPVPLVVVGEPTGLDVATCGKGVAWLEIELTAPGAHASIPLGPQGRPPGAAERLVALLAMVPADPLDVRHPTLGSCTAAITGVGAAETPFNVVPEAAWARIDCRFPAPATPEELEKAVMQAMGQPEDVEVKLVKREPAFESDEELGGMVARVLAGVGLEAGTIGVPYASEAGHWGPRAPTVICGPGSIDRAHKPDEYITVEELEDGVRAYRALLEAGRPID